MDGKTLDYLMSRMDSRRGSSDSRNRMSDGRGKGSVDFEGSMDFRSGRDSRDSRDYRDGYEEGYMDGRRGVKDSMDSNPSGHVNVDSRNTRDYHNVPRLSKTDIHRWKQMMENEDGSRGAHYDMQQIMEAAEKSNIRFEHFDEKEFCIAVNMMYSDYCKVAKKYVAPDKELHFFVDLAKAFLEDEDAPEASEKLAMYFHCIVDA